LPVQHIAGDVRHHRDRAAGHVDAVDRALVEVIGQHRVAGAVIGILADPAGAQHPAIAHFQQAAFQVIGHDRLPFSFPIFV
jgi:hypothetical protein